MTKKSQPQLNLRRQAPNTKEHQALLGLLEDRSALGNKIKNTADRAFPVGAIILFRFSRMREYDEAEVLRVGYSGDELLIRNLRTGKERSIPVTAVAPPSA